MKRNICLMIIMFLCVFGLCACGSEKGEGQSVEQVSESTISIEMLATEYLKVDLGVYSCGFKRGSEGEYEGWDYIIYHTEDESKGFAILYAKNIGGEKVVIPKTIEGYPVIEIHDGNIEEGGGFSDAIKEIEFPDTLCFMEPILNNTEWYKSQPDGEVYAGRVLYKYKGEMPEGTTITVKEGTIEIARDAFERCSGLKEVIMPDSVISIRPGAFQECRSLEKVQLSKNMIVMVDESFGTCTSLTELYLPKSLIYLLTPFEWCKGLTQIYYEGTEEEWNAILSRDDSVLRNTSAELVLSFENEWPY